MRSFPCPALGHFVIPGIVKASITLRHVVIYSWWCIRAVRKCRFLCGQSALEVRVLLLLLCSLPPLLRPFLIFLAQSAGIASRSSFRTRSSAVACAKVLHPVTPESLLKVAASCTTGRAHRPIVSLSIFVQWKFARDDPAAIIEHRSISRSLMKRR